jgi:hypothetical protein
MTADAQRNRALSRIYALVSAAISVLGFALFPCVLMALVGMFTLVQGLLLTLLTTFWTDYDEYTAGIVDWAGLVESPRPNGANELPAQLGAAGRPKRTSQME